jgi:ribosomal protein S18 acetylase RimI-like enzyme
MLWGAANKELSRMGNICAAAISLQSWFNRLLEGSDFIHTDDVIVLMWDRSTPFPSPTTNGVNIRPMMPEDLEIVREIDNIAFGTVWKNSLDALELAFQQSSLASVAELGDEIVGYQYSTSNLMGGHLARLAVKIGMQKRGIGYLLVHHVLSQFYKQGVTHVTVNTQQNNAASLALYGKAGFMLTGESYRVYQYNFK